MYTLYIALTVESGGKIVVSSGYTWIFEARKEEMEYVTRDSQIDMRSGTSF